MAQGTAVACSDIPALREVAGEAALRLPPRDVDAWVDALGGLLRNDDARERLVRLGLERASQFSWDRCADATVAVYQEALGG